MGFSLHKFTLTNMRTFTLLQQTADKGAMCSIFCFSHLPCIPWSPATKEEILSLSSSFPLVSKKDTRELKTFGVYSVSFSTNTACWHQCQMLCSSLGKFSLLNNVLKTINSTLLLKIYMAVNIQGSMPIIYSRSLPLSSPHTAHPILPQQTSLMPG